ncbi:Nucleosome assembly protein [Nesidiocoris tenuis]|nr:Nucleosome assembly protein [Nesidiocoris tenuis]
MSSEGDATVVYPGLQRYKDSESEKALAEKVLSPLPEKLKRRLQGLKRLQAQTALLEARFFQEVHKLECRYHEEYSKLHAKRDYIVRGAVEPTDDELYPGEPVRLIQGELAEKLAKDKFEGPGVPDFWPTIFKNVAVLNEIVYPCDEPILKHLIDVRCSLTENPMGFQLAFHFTPNEYFKNPILTKDYFMKCEPDKEDPFSFEGPEIFKAAGCAIDWNPGKNVTVKTVKKKQKHKLRGQTRVVTKEVKADSFFNFFSPPEFPDDPNVELDDETLNLLSADFELGHYMRERIVPHAVLYYTGELLDDGYEDDTTTESSDAEESASQSEGSATSGTKSQETEDGGNETGQYVTG